MTNKFINAEGVSKQMQGLLDGFDNSFSWISHLETDVEDYMLNAERYHSFYVTTNLVRTMDVYESGIDQFILFFHNWHVNPTRQSLNSSLWVDSDKEAILSSLPQYSSEVMMKVNRLYFDVFEGKCVEKFITLMKIVDPYLETFSEGTLSDFIDTPMVESFVESAKEEICDIVGLIWDYLSDKDKLKYEDVAGKILASKLSR